VGHAEVRQLNEALAQLDVLLRDHMQYKAEVRAKRRRMNEVLAVDRLLVLQWKHK
jgi:hypothetical protein